MQAPDQDNKSLLDELEKKVEQQLELSAAWRQLLGLEALKTAGADKLEAVPVLSHDPWNTLAHEQGIQTVDLQLAHVHEMKAGGEESEVEHALDMMQEQEKKPEK